MDSRRDGPFEDREASGPPVPTQAELEAMFDADDADVMMGRTVPAKPVLAEMRAEASDVRRDRLAQEVAPNSTN